MPLRPSPSPAPSRPHELLKLTDEQMAHAIGITAVTMGGLGIGTNSWAREYMGGNAAFCAVNAALAAGRGYTVNEDILEAQGGFLTVYGGGQAGQPDPDSRSTARSGTSRSIWRSSSGPARTRFRRWSKPP